MNVPTAIKDGIKTTEKHVKLQVGASEEASGVAYQRDKAEVNADKRTKGEATVKKRTKEKGLSEKHGILK
jgi:hypothetical protein